MAVNYAKAMPDAIIVSLSTTTRQKGVAPNVIRSFITVKNVQLPTAVPIA